MRLLEEHLRQNYCDVGVSKNVLGYKIHETLKEPQKGGKYLQICEETYI